MHDSPSPTAAGNLARNDAVLVQSVPLSTLLCEPNLQHHMCVLQDLCGFRALLSACNYAKCFPAIYLTANKVVFGKCTVTSGMDVK